MFSVCHNARLWVTDGRTARPCVGLCIADSQVHGKNCLLLSHCLIEFHFENYELYLTFRRTYRRHSMFLAADVLRCVCMSIAVFRRPFCSSSIPSFSFLAFPFFLSSVGVAVCRSYVSAVGTSEYRFEVAVFKGVGFDRHRGRYRLI